MIAIENMEAVREVARSYPGLRLLVLHGSRARGDSTIRSDWDFAYLGDENLDGMELRSRLVGALGRDDLDLANLSRAGGLLNFQVACDGVALFERDPGTFEEFCLQAATFWLDIEPVIRAEHEAILRALG
ncbi:MAG: nucleotidyltransferase domain-containing protein [Candidatus Binatia bacterium]